MAFFLKARRVGVSTLEEKKKKKTEAPRTNEAKIGRHGALQAIEN